jgi:hypothetical protein
MRSRNLLIVPVLAAVIAAGFTASARSYKRGVSENNFVERGNGSAYSRCLLVLQLGQHS